MSLDSLSDELSSIGNKNERTFYLMHKNIHCATFRLQGLNVVKFEVKNEEHMPNMFLDRNYSGIDKMRMWLKNRSIPKNRDFYDRILKNLNCINPLEIVLICKALRVTDCYWIKEENSTDVWETENFFNNFNRASDLLDRLYIESDLLTKSYEVSEKTLFNPNFTSEGSLPKIWRYNTSVNNWVLYKANRYYNEVDNEVLWSRILELFNVEHIEYWKGKLNNIKCALSENYCNNDMEFISAYDLTFRYKKNNQQSDVVNLCKYCKSLGLDMQQFLNVQLVWDYLLANADRHWNNFGIIREPISLKTLRIMPIYDNGNSLYFKDDLRFSFNDPNLNFTEREKTTKECLKYVTDFSFVRDNANKLKELPEMIYSLRFEINQYYQKERVDREVKKVKEHVDYLLTKI